MYNTSKAYEKLNELKKEILEGIKDFFKKFDIDELYLTDISCSTPVIIEDWNEADLTYTLDKISISDDRMDFDISNSCDSSSANAANLSVEVLAGVLDWLQDNNDKIRESLIDDSVEPEDEKKTFVFRFFSRHWVDIEVEASDEEEAEELATEKYNAGEYEDHDENFENTDIENVTDEGFAK